MSSIAGPAGGLIGGQGLSANPNYLASTDTSRYTSLALNWTPVTNALPGGVVSPYTEVAIRYSQRGFPVDIWDGSELLNSTNWSAALASSGTWNDALTLTWATDSVGVSVAVAANLNTGYLYYFTLLGYNSSTALWDRLGTAVGLVPDTYNHQSLLMQWTPEVYKSPNNDITGGSDEASDLYNFYGILGFQQDYLRSWVRTLRDLYDPKNVHALMIPALLTQFGYFKYEDELGTARNRALAKDALFIQQSKGSPTGLGQYLADVTGNAVQIKKGANLLLDYNDSSFKEITNSNILTATRWAYGVSTSNTYYSAPTITNNSGTNYYTMSIGASTGRFIMNYGGIAGTTGQNVGVNLLTPTQAVQNCIPLPVPNDVYTIQFSAYVSTSSTSPLFVRLQWYDATGQYLSFSTTTINGYVPGTFPTTVYGYASAPAGAVYCSPQLAYNNTFGTANTLYISKIQLEQNGTASNFVDANTVQALVAPTRVNRVQNPNFQIDGVGNPASYWTTANGTLVGDNTQILYGSRNGKFTVTGGTTQSFSSTKMQVHRDINYWAAIQLKAGQSKALPVTLSIFWYDSVVTGTDSQPTLISGNSTTTLVDNTGYHPVIVSAVAPRGATSAILAVSTAGRAWTNLLAASSASFEDGTTGGWSVNPGTTIANSSAQAFDGTKSLAMTCTTTGQISAYLGSPRPTPTPGQAYTLSFYVYGPAKTIGADIDWYTSAATYIRSDLASVQLTTANTWTRISITGIAPAGAAQLVPVVYVQNATSGEVYYIDAVQVEAGSSVSPFTTSTGNDILYVSAAQFEQGNQVLPYFDGSIYSNVGTANDAHWEGTVGGSRSFFYRRYDSIFGPSGRATSNLLNFLPNGTSQASLTLVPTPDNIEGYYYGKSNYWNYDLTHNWQQGLAEMWGTDDIFLDNWFYTLVGPPVTANEYIGDWGDTLSIDWEGGSIGIYYDTFVGPDYGADPLRGVYR